MAWIQVHQTLKDHRKVLAAADELDIEPAHMLGLLISFWLWALDNAPTGSLAGISPRMIARAAQYNEDPGKFVDALKDVGLLDTDQAGNLELHDWYEYTGKLIDQREAEKLRSRRRRADAAEAKPPTDRRATAGQSADGTQDNREKATGRVDQSRQDKTRLNQSRQEKEGEAANAAAPAADPVPYSEIVDLYHSICLSYPRLRNTSKKRKQAIAARWKEYGQNLETFRELFERAEASAFLKGKNGRNWAADFNWLLNSENMAKVLEGKYDEQRPTQAAPQGNGKGFNTMDVLADIIAAEEGGVVYDKS